MARIVFRVDESQKIGMGHFYRCLSLADLIPEYEIVFAMKSPSDGSIQTLEKKAYLLVSIPETVDIDDQNRILKNAIRSNDIVVLDGYDYSTEYMNYLKTLCLKLVVIDDLHDKYLPAD